MSSPSATAGEFLAFPNRIRERRLGCGFYRLQTLADAIPTIPYIRLSRLERGESFARPDELRAIAAALRVDPAALLPDPVGSEVPAAGAAAALASTGEPSGACKLAAATRLRRKGRWTVGQVRRQFHLPPVILSRLEAGSRPFERWNEATRSALCRMFDVADDHSLLVLVEQKFDAGELAAGLAALDDRGPRMARQARRMKALRRDLGESETVERQRPDSERRMLSVAGSPLAGGLISSAPAGGLAVEAPCQAGTRAFALRVCAPTLGPGLPAHAVVIADPDVPALPGGLAVLKVGNAFRLLALGFGRGGTVRGITVAPPLDVPIHGFDATDLSAVIAVVFP